MNREFIKEVVSRSRRQQVALLVSGAAVLILGAALLNSVHAVGASGGGTSGIVTRSGEPVVVQGANVQELLGVHVDELFVYAYAGSEWKQLPAQVDEVTAAGAYTVTEDNILDANDEIVFMAMDLGGRTAGGASITATLPVSDTFYALDIFDPINPAQRGWAYLFRSKVLTPTVSADYVDYDTDLDRIDAVGYSLGFTSAQPNTVPFFEYLSLGDTDTDILDRTKIRAYPTIPFLPVATENILPGKPIKLVKDGAVRVILKGGKGLGYGSMIAWSIVIPSIPEFYRAAVRYSTDFTPAVAGSVLYNSAVPEGVTVNGVQDNVPSEPLSSWWQLSTADGTAVQVGDSSTIGGAQVNYYLDDSSFYPEDTGDGRSYGDTGVYVSVPNSSITYTFSVYFLPGSQPNVGEEYVSFFSEPLRIRSYYRGVVPLYLPLIARSKEPGSR